MSTALQGLWLTERDIYIKKKKKKMSARVCTMTTVE